VIGSSFRQFMSADDRISLKALLKRSTASGSKIEMSLKAGDNSQLPVQISIRPLPRDNSTGAFFGIVVTDITEARRTRELLQALSRRTVEAQETERRRIAIELHDDITQYLCAILFRFQMLMGQLPDRDGALKKEALKLLEMLGRTADDVERISRDLRPAVLEQLGLREVLRVTRPAVLAGPPAGGAAVSSATTFSPPSRPSIT